MQVHVCGGHLYFLRKYPSFSPNFSKVRGPQKGLKSISPDALKGHSLSQFPGFDKV